MKKLDSFFTMLVIALISLSVATGFPQVKAVTNGNESSTSVSTTTSVNQMARESAITVQATLSPLQAFPTNSIVNNRAYYDVSFKTATSGTIRQVLLTFPAGTIVSSAAVVEASGIGPGTFSNSGQTVTYTVTSPTTIAAGVTVRLQVDYIFNPPTPNPVGGYKIQVTTKNPTGMTIDTGMTSGYQIKQIGTADIADNAVTTAKIGNSQVTTSNLAFGAVTETKIKLGSIIADNIQDSAVQTTKIADEAVTSPKIASGAVRLDTIIVVGSIQVVQPGSTAYSVATCPSDRIVTGGGSFAHNDVPNWDKSMFVLQESRESPTTWLARYHNSDNANSHNFQTMAICTRLSP
jgi:hypothetical protein